MQIRIVGSVADRRIRRRKTADVTRADLHAVAVLPVPVADARAAAGIVVRCRSRPRRADLELAREDLDHAADRVGAPVARARTAHDLDALDRIERQPFERERAGVRRRRAHAVDQHEHVIRVRAAQEQRSLLARAAGAVEIDAGLQTQHIEHVARAARVDVARA